MPAAIGAALLDRGRTDAGDSEPPAAAGHDLSAGEAGPGRHRPIVALTGDGGLLMCNGELLTAVRERLRLIVIVFADASLSLIDIKQQQRRLPSSGIALGAIDWCALAASMGAAPHMARAPKRNWSGRWHPRWRTRPERDRSAD